MLMRFAADLTTYGTVESQPRMEGRNAHVLISPVKAVVKPPEKAEKPHTDKPHTEKPHTEKPQAEKAGGEKAQAT